MFEKTGREFREEKLVARGGKIIKVRGSMGTVTFNTTQYQ